MKLQQLGTKMFDILIIAFIHRPRASVEKSAEGIKSHRGGIWYSKNSIVFPSYQLLHECACKVARESYFYCQAKNNIVWGPIGSIHIAHTHHVWCHAHNLLIFCTVHKMLNFTLIGLKTTARIRSGLGPLSGCATVGSQGSCPEKAAGE